MFLRKAKVRFHMKKFNITYLERRENMPNCCQFFCKIEIDTPAIQNKYHNH